MARQQNDHLFKLIKSLTKAEKRNFKLYANRIGTGEDIKFISLFDAIDKQKEYDETDILKKNKDIKPSQLANLKANLNKNLLVSLQLSAQKYDAEISLRQQIDFAKILYNKALYRQSITILQKAKLQAKKMNKQVLYYEMLEFEKMIEAQYVTRSMDNRAEQLVEEANSLRESINIRGVLSNLTLELYGFYLKNGHIRNEDDKQRITEFFNNSLPEIDENELGFYDKFHLYCSYVWYNHILQDFVMVYRYSLKWVEMFRQTPEAIENQTDLYVKGLDHLLDGLNFTGNYDRFGIVLKELGELRYSKRIPLTKNEEILTYEYYYAHSINKYYQEGRFSDGLSLIPEIVEFIDDNIIYLDNHIVLIFYYKIACLYFGAAENKNAVKYLNMVINFRDESLRSDIQCFARILNLISHFEMENYDLVEYLVKSTYRFLAKMEDLHQVQKEILMFLRRLPQIPQSNLVSEFENLLTTFKRLRKDPYEKRPFLYLDIISWLESKIEGVPVQYIIRRKFLEMK